jgi:hypothetical protein
MMTKMMGAAVVAALCFAAPHGARAELTCGPMKFFKGESGRNPVAYTSIAIDNGAQWYVGHHMQNGDVYYRQNQYNMGPLQRSYNVATGIGWEGDRQSNPDFHMNGLLWKQRGHWWYGEQVTYKGQLKGYTTQDCGSADQTIVSAEVPQDPPPPTYTAQVPAPSYTPAPVASGGDVPIIIDRNEALAMVMVGGRSIGMTIDTGATQGSLPTEFADQLIADGAATESEPMPFKMANDQVETKRTVIVGTVNIGGHIVHDIRFSVGGAALLGFNALSAVGSSFKIDHDRGVLSFS